MSAGHPLEPPFAGPGQAARFFLERLDGSLLQWSIGLVTGDVNMSTVMIFKHFGGPEGIPGSPCGVPDGPRGSLGAPGATRGTPWEVSGDPRGVLGRSPGVPGPP